MSNLAPVSVALKFGFLVVLYLFLLWVARSALRDLRGAAASVGVPRVRRGRDRAYLGLGRGRRQRRRRAPRLVVERAPGHEPGMIYDLDGRRRAGPRRAGRDPARRPLRVGTPRAHLQQGGSLVVEDLGSTNGTYLNEELLDGPRRCIAATVVRIGDSEFSYEAD